MVRLVFEVAKLLSECEPSDNIQGEEAARFTQVEKWSDGRARGSLYGILLCQQIDQRLDLAVNADFKVWRLAATVRRDGPRLELCVRLWVQHTKHVIVVRVEPARDVLPKLWFSIYCLQSKKLGG